MGKTAFLFSGQGSQHTGMAGDLFENIPEVHDFFEAAEKIRPGTLMQLLQGPDEELKETQNCQPCLFLADIAGAIALESLGVHPDAVAGFSLGEVVGFAVSGAVSGEKAFELVCKRGHFMKDASDKVNGSMVAVLRMNVDELKELCSECGVYPVNFNCPGQIVVSGEDAAMQVFKEALKEKDVRFMELAVSGSFHTPYMKEASERLLAELTEENIYNINKTYIPLYANRTAEPYPDEPLKMAGILSEQVSNSVRWEETLLNMSRDGVDTFIECGPGKTLSGFVKRTLPSARVYSVNDMKSLLAAKEAIENNKEMK